MYDYGNIVVKKKNGCKVLVATYFNIGATCKSHTKLRP